MSWCHPEPPSFRHNHCLPFITTILKKKLNIQPLFSSPVTPQDSSIWHRSSQHCKPVNISFPCTFIPPPDGVLQDKRPHPLFFFKEILHYVFYFFIVYFFNLFIYFWLHWVFVAARGLSLVVGSGGYSALRCTGFSLRWLLLLRSTGSRRAGFSSCGSRALERSLSSCGARA